MKGERRTRLYALLSASVLSLIATAAGRSP
jgi:hypothetical protein